MHLKFPNWLIKLTDQLDTLTFFTYNKAFVSISVSVMAHRPSFNSHQTLLRSSHLPQLIVWRLKSRTASHLTNSILSSPASSSMTVTLFPTTTSKRSPPSISSYAICMVVPTSLPDMTNTTNTNTLKIKSSDTINNMKVKMRCSHHQLNQKRTSNSTPCFTVLAAIRGGFLSSLLLMAISHKLLTCSCHQWHLMGTSQSIHFYLMVLLGQFTKYLCTNSIWGYQQCWQRQR